MGFVIAVDGPAASGKGTVASRLAALYDYMLARLLAANLRNDAAILDEIAGLLNELRGAWAQIGQQGANATAGEAISK